MIQNRLRNRVSLTDWMDKDGIRTIAGIANLHIDTEGTVYTAVHTLSLPKFNVVEETTARLPSRFPYVAGLLVFREGPCIVRALESLRVPPDLLMFAGHGYAHPRRIGLATHIGLLFDLPSIGVAQSRLWGSYEEPSVSAGSYTFLEDDGEILGAAVRTRTEAEPLLVSIGHKIGITSAIDIVLQCTRHGRFPEPMQRAHSLVREVARATHQRPMPNSGTQRS